VCVRSYAVRCNPPLFPVKVGSMLTSSPCFSRPSSINIQTSRCPSLPSSASGSGVKEAPELIEEGLCCFSESRTILTVASRVRPRGDLGLPPILFPRFTSFLSWRAGGEGSSLSTGVLLCHLDFLKLVLVLPVGLFPV
jgi:hypothetical protein